MLAFNASTNDGSLDIVIFARRRKDAVIHFWNHCFHLRNEMPEDFYVWRRLLRNEDDPDALRQALRQGREGLGEFVDGAWTITPIPDLLMDGKTE